MSLQPSKSRAQEDKVSLLSDNELDRISLDAGVPAQHLKTKTEEKGDGRPQFLRAPRSGPIRPLSPDTFSNLSVEEYEQIRPGRGRAYQNGSRQPSRSPAPPTTWKGKLCASWIRNKGLFYMLIAQVFGTLMNVTTRLLEVEGNKGKGLHPFQVGTSRAPLYSQG